MDTSGVNVMNGNTIKRSYLRKGCSTSKLRALLNLIVGSSPTILDIGNCDQEGEVIFSVSMKEAGITYNTFKEFKLEIFSNFVVDFMGELLIRENIDLFASKLTTIDSEAYADIVNEYEHKRFGMKILQDNLVFSFHVSLLQDILTEDFKRQIKK